jgi:sugar lactone lactonase YvrE
VSTLAGLVQGYLDGPTRLALFSQPSGLAVDVSRGGLIVADAGNDRVRRITRDGQVMSVNTLGAGLKDPRGVTIDADGTIVVADTGNHRICQIVPERRTLTLAGSSAGHRDGAGAEARFRRPKGLAVTARRTILVADSGNRSIRRITAEGEVSTLGPLSGAPTGGAGLAARFLQPAGLSVAPDGRIAVADEGNHTIREVDAGGRVTTLAGRGSRGSVGGDARKAAFNNPCDVTTDRKGGWIVADAGNGLLRRIAPEGNVSNLLAPSRGPLGWLRLPLRPATPTLITPSGVAVAPHGDVIVSDRGRHSIYRVSSGGTLTHIAGNGWAGYADARGNQARFSSPAGLAVDATGAVYVADTGNHCIRVVEPNGMVRTLAGGAKAGLAEGRGATARFTSPVGLALGGDGALVVADTGNHAIRRVDLDGSVTTVAGAGIGGFRDASGKAAHFSSPAGVAWLGPDELLVADSGNRCLRLVR